MLWRSSAAAKADCGQRRRPATATGGDGPAARRRTATPRPRDGRTPAGATPPGQRRLGRRRPGRRRPGRRDPRPRAANRARPHPGRASKNGHAPVAHASDARRRTVTPRPRDGRAGGGDRGRLCNGRADALVGATPAGAILRLIRYANYVLTMSLDNL